MVLEQAYFISQILAGIVLIASILFLALQVRQNFKVLEHSLTEDRRQAESWLFERIVTDAEFRDFHRRISADFENCSDDDKYRAEYLAQKNMITSLSGLQARFDGFVSNNEWISLENRLKFIAMRPNVQMAWTKVKSNYPQKVRDYWENLPRA